MSFSPVLMLTASLLLSASLLWLAAELAVLGPSRAPGLRGGWWWVTTALTAAALWWPANAVRTGAAGAFAGVPAWFTAALAATALAALTGAIGTLWQRGRRVVAVSCAAALPATAYVYAMLNAAALLHLAGTPAWLGAGVLTLLIAVALLAGRLSAAESHLQSMVRAGAALVTAGGTCAGTALSVTAADAARWTPGPQWAVMPALVVLAAALLGTVRQRQRSPRLQASAAATTDHLTGLPSRLYFEGRLQAEMQRADARGRHLAVFFIDLDGFKPVNDSYGHSSGDKVLEQVAQRLQALARGTKLTARIGGDKFLLMASGDATREGAVDLATRLIDAVGQPYLLDDREITVSCSVGIALYPDKKTSAAKLIARADAAMYAAKRAGGGRHCFHAPEMDAGAQQNLDMLADLRRALANDEFELYFQPKIDARSGKVTAAEALLRWRHPTLGVLSPNTFIPLAERSGLIGPIGNWVVEAACRQARAWRDKGLRMRVAINLSAHQMRQDDLADRIAEALARHRIQPMLLTCEITETAAMEDTAATQETFRRLGELGAHVSIDDFGTGYSSLAYLRRLPAEELKIDASFVKDLDHGADARAVIDAVVKLAHALGLKVVAEGVETVRQHKALLELGCDELQGYLFAKPMTARALLLWAMDDRSASAVFRESLFSETRQVSRQGSSRQGGQTSSTAA